MYQKTNSEIEKKIHNILEGEYEISVLGTNGKDKFPFLSKIIPMYINKKIYVLISDLSEHTKNIQYNHSVSIYFALKELNKTKSNNPRLTISGIIKKHAFNKNDPEFLNLLESYQKIEKGGVCLVISISTASNRIELYILKASGKLTKRIILND